MVPELVLIALLAGWLTGGKFWRLADVRIKCVWLIFVPLALYVVSWLPALRDSTWFLGALAITEKLALIVIPIVNWRMPGMRLIFLGVLLNLIALVANHGWMPVSPDAIAAAYGPEELKNQLAGAAHVRSAIMDASSNLGFLCDIISAHKPFLLVPAVYSVGDLVMTSGIFVAIIAIMRTPLPTEKISEKAVAESA